MAGASLSGTVIARIGGRAENATQRKLNALAEALAELMDKLDNENPDPGRATN